MLLIGRELIKKDLIAGRLEVLMILVYIVSVFGFQGIILARWLSWLERRPVTAEVVGSSPIRVVNGILAQLGEHLPYKQRVTGSSPVGPIF